MSFSTFIDGIVLSQRFQPDTVKSIAGLRTIAYREAGDIAYDGSVVEEQDVLPVRLRSAWIQGSHSTKVQVSSDGTLVQLKGNPGRFGRGDNLFNLGFDETIAASNQILNSQGLPSFVLGEPVGRNSLMFGMDGQLETRAEFAGYLVIPNEGTPEYEHARRFCHPGDLTPGHEGARVWSIHVTRNYIAGSEANALAVLNWLDGQSVSRVKKQRFGKSTVTWGTREVANLPRQVLVVENNMESGNSLHSSLSVRLRPRIAVEAKSRTTGNFIFAQLARVELSSLEPGYFALCEPTG